MKTILNYSIVTGVSYNTAKLELERTNIVVQGKITPKNIKRQMYRHNKKSEYKKCMAFEKIVQKKVLIEISDELLAKSKLLESNVVYEYKK